jgi:hypothetical protein
MDDFKRYHVAVDTTVTARLDHPGSDVLYRAYRAKPQADLPFMRKCYKSGYSAGYCATMVVEGLWERFYEPKR